LKTLEAKKEDNAVSKKLYRFSSAFICGLTFHFFASAGSSLNFSLVTFLLLQLALVMLLETIESYAYTSKIDVSRCLDNRVCLAGHQEADEV
jgi:hypothetical protein